MKLEQIKRAIESGREVCVGNDNYRVYVGEGGWFIICLSNNYAIGLTRADGVTLNAKELDFYIKG